MKVYLATRGTYSDYHVIGVFATRELAESVGEEVEERELYDAIPRKLVSYEVTSMPWDRDPEPEIRKHVYYPWDYEAEWFSASRRPKVSVWNYGQGLSGLRVSGSDRDVVAKAFRDRRAEMLAEREGVA